MSSLSKGIPVCLVLVMAMSCASNRPESDVGLQQVDAVRRAPTLYAKAAHLWQISEGGRSKTRVVEHPDGTVHNSGLAYQHSHKRLLFAQNNQIFALSPDGEVTGVVPLGELSLSGVKEPADAGFQIGPQMAVDDGRLAFSLLGDDDERENAYCVVTIKNKAGRCVHVPSSSAADYDFSSDTLYHRATGESRVIVKRRLDGETDRVLKTQKSVYWLSVGPSPDTLLVGTDGPDGNARLFAYNRKTAERTMLSSSPRAVASLLDESRVLLSEATNKLELVDLDRPDRSRKTLLEVPGGDTGQPPVSPVVSRDGNFVAWLWGAKAAEGAKRGLAVISLSAREFAVTDLRTWHLEWGADE